MIFGSCHELPSDVFFSADDMEIVAGKYWELDLLVLLVITDVGGDWKEKAAVIARMHAVTSKELELRILAYKNLTVALQHKNKEVKLIVKERKKERKKEKICCTLLPFLFHDMIYDM